MPVLTAIPYNAIDTNIKFSSNIARRFQRGRKEILPYDKCPSKPHGCLYTLRTPSNKNYKYRKEA